MNIKYTLTLTNGESRDVYSDEIYSLRAGVCIYGSHREKIVFTDTLSTVVAALPNMFEAVLLNANSIYLNAGKVITTRTETFGTTIEYQGRNFPVSTARTTLNATINTAAQSTNKLKLNTSAALTASKGEIVWNDTDGTASLGINGIAVDLGQDMTFYIKNQTGSDISAGTAIRASGAVGVSGRVNGAPMIADGSISPKYLIGIAAEDIANGADGYVISVGKVQGLDTSAWSAGDVLYCDPTTPGGLTSTIPSAPNLKLAIAFVTVSHAQNGVMAVRANAGSSLNEDNFVELTSIADKDILQYNSSTKRIENKSLSSAGIAPSSFGIGEWTYTISSPSETDYLIRLNIPFGGTINETTTICSSGTAIATFKVNTTALGDAANDVSSVENIQAHGTDNTFVAGDDIYVTISSLSSAANITMTIKYTRTA